MARLIFHVIIGVLSFWLAIKFVSGVMFTGGTKELLLAGCVLGLINFFIRPILKIISAPLIILSLGLFTLVINIFLLWVLTYLVPELVITGFWSYFWGVLIISLVNILFSAGRKKKEGIA